MGDSTATGQGGVNFERNETWNLGQMVRGTFGLEKTWIVGQYTYGGSVTAASRWGGEHSAMKLKDAIKDSYEDHLHAIERETGKPFTFVTAPFLGQPEGVLRQMLDEKHVVAGALFDMCSAARKQRWVGVQYVRRARAKRARVRARAKRARVRAKRARVRAKRARARAKRVRE